jgi:hypothetical protein
VGSHPVNLALRFLLELGALAATGYWGWRAGGGAWRFLLALGVPLLLAVAWGAFAVPGDPSRSGNAPVPVPGIARLIMELAIFGFAAWALYAAGQPVLGLILAISVVAHYALSYDRVAWLLRR